MSTLLIVLVLACQVVLGADGPFGLHAGMTLEELIREAGDRKNVSLAQEGTNVYEVKSLKKGSPSFRYYLAVVSPTRGLVKLHAVGKMLETSVYGDELRQEYNHIVELITAKYGSPKSYDYLKAGSIWSEPNEWMKSLYKKERELVSFWKVDSASVAGIKVEAVALSSSSGYVSLGYELPGFIEYTEEQAARQKDVF